MIWEKINQKMEKDKIKEEETRGGEPGGEGKGEKMRGRMKKQKEEKKEGGSSKKKKRKGGEENERKGGEILDTYRSIKLDSIDIKFRYLVLLNTRNLLMVSDKNFNS